MRWICILLLASAALAQTQPAKPDPAQPDAVKPDTTKPDTAKPDTAKPDAVHPPSPADAMRAALEKQRASIEKQKEAVRKQAESLGTWTKPGDPPPSISAGANPLQANCPPLADSEIAPIIESNAKVQQVQPELLRAVIEQESGLRPCAVSSKGAQGLMQLMPATSQDFGVHDPFDVKENVAAGAKYLKQLMDKYNGDLSKALGAYNAGPAAVDQAGGVPDIQETKDYVEAILKKLATRTAPPNSPTPKPIGN